MSTYKVYDHFLNSELDSARNYAEDLYDSRGRWLGWHVVMADGAGLTGERIAAWDEGDIGKVSLESGALDASIIAADTVKYTMSDITSVAGSLLGMAMLGMVIKNSTRFLGKP